MLDATASTNNVVAGGDLGGRRVLVTGGAGGLGFAPAEALATARATIAIADHDVDRAREAVQWINPTFAQKLRDSGYVNEARATASPSAAEVDGIAVSG